jgi:hypothetical protein
VRHFQSLWYSGDWPSGDFLADAEGRAECPQTVCCLRTQITHRTPRAAVSNERLFSSNRNIHANGKVKLHFLFFIHVNRHGLVFISIAITVTSDAFSYRERLSYLVVTDWNNFKCQSCRSVVSSSLLNLLAPELFFFFLTRPVYKMSIIQESNTLELWNKLHFE